ncbi:uncharacterized protein LOC129906948 [Episyrphus balteatus]|uniref:uncharacterized protein LOC129906948 n=1 Tax=Episyrphus balteatus TaxID=286459 RepID=UPI002486C899|nr:uncharacterized protein LOC129906948 [Episyrphus balteatus]
MKLICSILILAGVLDAFAMQMPKMELWNRASSACRQSYDREKNAILNKFNAANKDCDNALQARLKKLNEGAAATLKELRTSVATVCAISGKCTESGPAADNLNCFKTKGHERGNTLKLLLTEASTARAQLQKDIANAKGIEAVCKEKADIQENEAADAALNKFYDCVNGKTPSPTPPTTKATTPRTEATTPPTTKATQYYFPTDIIFPSGDCNRWRCCFGVKYIVTPKECYNCSC